MAFPNNGPRPSANWVWDEHSQTWTKPETLDDGGMHFTGPSGYPDDENWPTDDSYLEFNSQQDEYYYYEDDPRYLWETSEYSEGPSHRQPPPPLPPKPTRVPTKPVDLSKYTEEELRIALEQKVKTQDDQHPQLIPTPQRFPPPEQKFPPPQQRFPPPQQRFPPPEQRFPKPQQRFPPPEQRFPPPQRRFPPPEQRFHPPEQRFPPPQQRFPPPQQRFPPPQQRFPPPEQRFPPPEQRFPPPQQRFPQRPNYRGPWGHAHFRADFNRYPPPTYSGYDPHYQGIPMPPASLKVEQTKKKPKPDDVPTQEESEEESTSSEYEEEEDEKPNAKQKAGVSPKNKIQKGKSAKKTGKASRGTVSSDDEISSEEEDILLPKTAKKISRSSKKVHPPKQTTKRRLGIIKNFQQLQTLGTFVKMSESKPEYGIVRQYFENGFGQLPRQPRIRIHAISELNKATPLPTQIQTPPTPQVLTATPTPLISGFGIVPPITTPVVVKISSAATATPSPPVASFPCDVLLWSKTSSRSVEAICSDKSGITSYYDRSVRALSLKLPEIRGSFRQILLLSAVSLGNMEKSKEDFSSWKRKGKSGVKQGSDTVKCVGRFTPDWDDSKELTSPRVLIPCGKTKRNRASIQANLDFSEYIVFEQSKAKVMYAVDVEITP